MGVVPAPAFVQAVVPDEAVSNDLRDKFVFQFSCTRAKGNPRQCWILGNIRTNPA